MAWEVMVVARFQPEIAVSRCDPSPDTKAAARDRLRDRRPKIAVVKMVEPTARGYRRARQRSRLEIILVISQRLHRRSGMTGIAGQEDARIQVELMPGSCANGQPKTRHRSDAVER